MTLLLAIFALVLIVGAIKRDQLPGGSLTLTILAILALLTVVGRLFFQGPPSAYTGTYEQAAGTELARPLAEKFPEGGTVLIIQYHSTMPHIQDVSKAQRKGVTKVLSGSEWNLISVGPDFLIDENTIELNTSGSITNRQFEEWLSDNPNTTAIISFLGLPRAKPKTPLPPTCALLAGPLDHLPKWKDPNLLRIASWKEGINPMKKAPSGASSEEVFARRFEWAAP